MPLDQNPHQTVTLQCMRAGFLCPKCDKFACFHTRQDQNELDDFLPEPTSFVSRSQAHFPALFKRIMTLLLYFCLLVKHVNKSTIFVFGAFVYHFKNTISSFVTIF